MAPAGHKRKNNSGDKHGEAPFTPALRDDGYLHPPARSARTPHRRIDAAKIRA